MIDVVELVAGCAPTRAHAGDAGLDLRAHTRETIEPGEMVMFGAGIRVAIPAQHVGLVFARSGLSTKHGIVLANNVGVIDHGYAGEVMIPLLNASETPYTVEVGERIAQLVITPIITPTVRLVDALPESERGEGGFGSSGRA